MSATYGVAGTSPFADFSQDIENIIIDYLYQEWSILDPAKPSSKTGIGQNIEFRPGFDRGMPTYQVLCIQTDTEVTPHDVSIRSWKFVTRVEITVITNKMGDIDNVKPQLGYMEREVQRILNQYNPYEIPGIINVSFQGQTRVYDDIIAGSMRNPQIRGSRGGSTKSTTTSSGGVGNWFTSRWKTRIFADIEYYKDDISS